MKKLIFVIASLLFVGGSTVRAQDQDRDRDQVKKQDRIHQEDHLILKDGKVYQVKLGTQTQLQTQLKLKNGTVVNPDGTYQLKNQDRFRLRDGECMDMNGNRYLNQSKFNQRSMMTNKELERVRNNEMNKNKPINKSNGKKGRN